MSESTCSNFVFRPSTIPADSTLSEGNSWIASIADLSPVVSRTAAPRGRLSTTLDRIEHGEGHLGELGKGARALGKSYGYFGAHSFLVTVVTQDARTGAVLMVAQADQEALERTVATGEMHFRSRTRGLWHKGATSGNVQRVVSLTADCDGDVLLARVIPAGPACHSGSETCFGSGEHADLTSAVLDRLDRTIADRASTLGEDRNSYTHRLLADRNLRLKKLGEECAELVTACADGDRERAVGEGADLVDKHRAAVAARVLVRPEHEVVEK